MPLLFEKTTVGSAYVSIFVYATWLASISICNSVNIQLNSHFHYVYPKQTFLDVEKNFTMFFGVHDRSALYVAVSLTIVQG
jgi:hypothetical protein